MRTQKETDLEDEIECLKADLADALTLHNLRGGPCLQQRSWRFIIDELEKENAKMKAEIERLKGDYPEYNGITDFIECMFDYAKVVDVMDSDNATHELVVHSIWGVNDQLDRIALLEEVVEAAQEFCDRRDRGEVRSTYTYNKFKEAIAKLDESTMATQYERTGPNCSDCGRPSENRLNCDDFHCPDCDIDWWQET